MFNKDRPFRSIIRFVIYTARYLSGKRFHTYSNFETPISTYVVLKGAVVVYGEGVKGNPLLANKIVRWLLHKPGFHTGEVEYTSNELFFYYHESFNDVRITSGKGHKLRVTLILDDIYKQTNFGPREGTCYIVRKGGNRSDLPDLSKEIVIDGMRHEEIAEIFNKVEYCVSYDPYTMYSRYAVMCGCKSIVVPEGGVSKEEWRPDEAHRYGISYGFDDLEYALNTKKLLMQLIQNEKVAEREMVRDFVNVCTKNFA